MDAGRRGNRWEGERGDWGGVGDVFDCLEEFDNSFKSCTAASCTWTPLAGDTHVHPKVHTRTLNACRHTKQPHFNISLSLPSSHTHTQTKKLKKLSSVYVQPSISRYTGEALARLRSKPWISFMLSLMCGSLCQQPSIRSYTSLGQVLGRCSTLPWVIHSITYKVKHKENKMKKLNQSKWF